MKTLKYSIIILLLISVSCNKNGHNHSEEEHQHGENDHHDHGKTEIEKGHEEDIIITKAQFKANQMQLGNVTEQPFSELVKTTGFIDIPPQNKEIISAISGGYIKKTALLVGDKVKKGQALVSIENPKFIDLQQKYLEVFSQMTYLKSEYNRQKTLFNENITSKKIYLKAKSDYNRNAATYNGLRKRLRLLNISPANVERGNITSTITLYASIAGSVTLLNVSKGTYVSSQDVIMEIVNMDHIHLELTVFEKDIMQIKEEQRINFSIPEASTKKYEADVHLVGTAIDAITRTVKVHGHLPENEKHSFVVGMFVNAEIETTTKKGLAIPSSAILENEEHFVVLVLKTEKNEKYIFESKEVIIGKVQNNFTEIISKNIQVTDKILIKGGYSFVGEVGAHTH